MSVTPAAPPEETTRNEVEALREEVSRLRTELEEQRRYYDEKLASLLNKIEQVQ
jgi:hypothetical protein